MLAVIAFLQSDAAWWKGPAAALALGLLGYLVFTVSFNQDGFTPQQPGMGLVIGAWLCGLIVLIGSVLALIMRNFYSAGKIAKLIFLGSSSLIFVSLMAMALTHG